MGQPAISAREVSKRFLIHRKRATSLKERFINRGAQAEEFWAVRDLSLDVEPGETVGLVGANGSGKSTTLKLLAGILQPTSGTVTVNGRIASLLELGAGFNGELSGRDNVYLNASLLGLSRKEVDRHFDDIVAFSELAPFIDNQVKNYSSGMYVRLGFAVAVHIDPDILLVDEVLAVGDEAFQRKCLDKIEQFQRDGRTILFVSHSLELVEQICSRSVVLDHGRVRYIGEPEFATGTLRGILGTDKPRETAVPTIVDDPRGGAYIHGATVSDRPGGEPRSDFFGGEPLSVRVEVEVLDGTDPIGGQVTLIVLGAGDIPIWVMGQDGRGVVPPVPGRYHVDFVVPELPPVVGSFIFAVSVNDPDTDDVLAHARFYETLHFKGNTNLGIVDVRYTAETWRADG
ncbi:MAG TPA: polysaccharide ABC transporter ATP-binding protein [Frankiaceae bacterium]|nr:polysaccharide ABC transporter ATP-binding protein [Frankiaceae bacterium]